MKKTNHRIVSYAEGIAHYARRQGFMVPDEVMARARRIPGRFAVNDDPEHLDHVNCVLCLPDGSGEYFADDIRTTCARCGIGIHHRPSVPNVPPKLCTDCAMNGPEDGSPEDWERYIREGWKEASDA